MSTGKFLRIGLLCLITFTFLCSPFRIGSVFESNPAFAANGIAPLNDEAGEPAVVVSDPLQGFNRAMFTLNDRLYFWVLKPVSTIYAAYFPPGARAAIRNGFYNLLFPARVVGCVLQGKMEPAGRETARFFINSTLGAGGLFDVAETGFAIHTHEEDFGQTLAVWGAGPGPFLMLPVFGPSNFRDVTGLAADSFLDPLYWIPVAWWIRPSVRTGQYVNNTSLRIGEYEDFKKSALDPYISMRDAYMQYRQKEIRK